MNIQKMKPYTKELIIGQFIAVLIAIVISIVVANGRDVHFKALNKNAVHQTIHDYTDLTISTKAELMDMVYQADEQLSYITVKNHAGYVFIEGSKDKTKSYSLFNLLKSMIDADKHFHVKEAFFIDLDNGNAGFGMRVERK